MKALTRRLDVWEARIEGQVVAGDAEGPVLRAEDVHLELYLRQGILLARVLKGCSHLEHLQSQGRVCWL